MGALESLHWLGDATYEVIIIEGVSPVEKASPVEKKSPENHGEGNPEAADRFNTAEQGFVNSAQGRKKIEEDEFAAVDLWSSR